MRDHLLKVSEIASQYGREIDLEEPLQQAGLLHDLGKYSDMFQDLILRRATGVDHAMSGAAVLHGKGGVAAYMQEAVAAHHEGLMAHEMLDSYMTSFLTGKSYNSPMPKHRAISFTGTAGLKVEIDRAKSDGLVFKLSQGDVPKLNDSSRVGRMRRMLMSRMVLSCLVDADHTVSAWEESGDDGLFEEHGIDDADACLSRLEVYRNDIICRSKAKANVNRMRDTVYKDCAAAGAGAYRLQSLTAPTGSGKTLAMIRFALERVKSDKSLRRAIFVLPYLSLVDQAADACRKVFPYVLIDDSVEDNPDQLLSKRWNVPCVVTTSVQFFQSLFSAYPGDVRKLHRMANSVIVFDEVQSLPLDVFRLAMDALKELSERYNAHILLSTATKPGYNHMPDIELDVRECIRNVPELFGTVKRTGIEVLPDRQSVSDIAAMAVDYKNACIVSNLKKQALDAYKTLKEAGMENVFLVSTNLCPLHRRDVISKIGQLQKAKKSVHVSSTQCLEAGVDLDFEKVFRMLAPYTALVQAAGRQNRNGIYSDGNISVFVPTDKRWWPDGQYQRQANIVREMAAAGVSLDGLFGVDEYYRRLFPGFDEPKELSSALDSIDFVNFARKSKLIKQRGHSVVVPYGNDGIYESFADAVLNDRFEVSMLQNAAGITVQTYDCDGVKACCAEAVIRGRNGRLDIHTGTYVLLPCRSECYKLETGLELGSGFGDML